MTCWNCEEKVVTKVSNSDGLFCSRKCQREYALKKQKEVSLETVARFKRLMNDRPFFASSDEDRLWFYLHGHADGVRDEVNSEPSDD